MDQHISKFRVNALVSQARADRFKELVKDLPGLDRSDVNLEKRIVRIITNVSLDVPALKRLLQPHGFSAHELSETAVVDPVGAVAIQETKECEANVYIQGMTCRSCELTIERKWKKLDGVTRVDVNAATGKARIVSDGKTYSLKELRDALGQDKYVLSATAFLDKKRPTFWQLVGLFGLVFLIGKMLSGLGLLNSNITINEGMSFGAIFVIGLVAASSSCIAVTGGLLLSTTAKIRERYGNEKPIARMRPVFLFILGRIASYTVLGGLLGVVGGILAPSATVSAVLMIAASVYMVVMGLDMLHIAPAWLKRLMPRMPKSLAHRILNAEGKEHPGMPLLLGGATFFLPCGFTQALQLYALTTKNFGSGAISLLAFALGTAPALLALGWASTSLKGKAGQFFFKFSGALVIVLGLWNIQNGMALAGYPIVFPTFSSTPAVRSGSETVIAKGETQIIKMSAEAAGYVPDSFTLHVGVPVRWEIDGTNAAGCERALVSSQLGIRQVLNPGLNVINFTPTQAGEIAFSCSMGMYRGSFTVLSS